jgi:Leucine-rich repeat (LRR) protein
VAKLKQLTELLLFDNELGGEIPAGVCSLTNLRVLDLSNNKQYESKGGPFGHPGNVDVDFNKPISGTGLCGSIPDQLGELANLEELNLSGNAFEGEIPNAIAGLTSLKHLDLSANRLAGHLPEAIAKLTNLRHLNLNSNGFEGPMPLAMLLPLAPNLEVLILSNNKGIGGCCLPSVVGKFTKLSCLSLADLDLTGPVPNEMSNLTGLRTLGLSQNRLSGPNLPDLLQLLTPSLEALYLSQNVQIGGCDITSEMFAPFTKLSSLALVNMDLPDLQIIKKRLEHQLPNCHIVLEEERVEVQGECDY